MRINHKENLTLLGLISLVLMSGIVLALPKATADDGATSNVAIRVNSACSMVTSPEGSNDTPHTADLNPGTYQANIGKTTLKTICNDAEGFSIYAIGYTNEEYGNTTLKPSTLDATQNSIITGTATTAGNPDTSNWAMKVSPVTGTYAPTIESDTDGSFSDYHKVPSTYTKVATRTSNTDITTGSSIEITYSAYIAGTQPADLYNGKVKFTMVHPHNSVNVDAPEIPQSLIMQNVSQWASSVNVGDEVVAIDARDGKTYTIARLDDEILWMTQNLDLDITTQGAYNPTTNTYTAFTNENTDLGWNGNGYSSASWNPIPSAYTHTDADGMDWESYNEEFSSDPQYASLYANYDPENFPESYDVGDLYWNGQINQDYSGDYVNYTSNSGDSHFHLGNHYNWTAAIAMNDSSNVAGESIVAQSICPSGWTLPVAGYISKNDFPGSFQYMLEQYGWTSGFGSGDRVLGNGKYVWESPLYMPLSGTLYNNNGVRNEIYTGADLVLWSSRQEYSLSAWAFKTYDGRFIETDNNDNYTHRSLGAAVRCISRYN